MIRWNDKSVQYENKQCTFIETLKVVILHSYEYFIYKNKWLLIQSCYKTVLVAYSASNTIPKRNDLKQESFIIPAKGRGPAHWAAQESKTIKKF